MSRYIDAEEFAEKADRVLQSAKQEGNSFIICAFSDIFTLLLASAPTVDVEEIRHGQWLVNADEHMDIGFICSSCGEGWADISGFIYCPNCGAKMDL